MTFRFVICNSTNYLVCKFGHGSKKIQMSNFGGKSEIKEF
jgi:hypothetical protein